jgi:hypothetical protein
MVPEKTVTRHELKSQEGARKHDTKLWMKAYKQHVACGCACACWLQAKQQSEQEQH